MSLTDRKVSEAQNPAGAAYRPPQLNFLREVKVESPVHRLWAGSKILAVTGASVTLSYSPTWGALAVMTALLVGSTLIARIPLGAWPRLPGWFWVVIAVTGAAAAAAGGSPHLSIVGADLGLGGIDAYLKFVGVGVVLLLAAAVLGWTTPLGEIAPAVGRLLWPLRLFRVPVDEIAATIALSARSLPMIVEEVRTLVAARRLRPAQIAQRSFEIEHWLDGIVDVLVAALSVAVRRSGELAEAITARGGAAVIAAKGHKPSWNDALALSVVAGSCYAATLFPG